MYLERRRNAGTFSVANVSPKHKTQKFNKYVTKCFISALNWCSKTLNLLTISFLILNCDSCAWTFTHSSESKIYHSLQGCGMLIFIFNNAVLFMFSFNKKFI